VILIRETGQGVARFGLYPVSTASIRMEMGKAKTGRQNADGLSEAPVYNIPVEVEETPSRG